MSLPDTLPADPAPTTETQGLAQAAAMRATPLWDTERAARAMPWLPPQRAPQAVYAASPAPGERATGLPSQTASHPANATSPITPAAPQSAPAPYPLAAVHELQARLHSLEADLAAHVARVATLLAQRVLHHEVRTSSAHIAQFAREAVAELVAGASDIRIHLHPHDCQALAAAAGPGTPALGTGVQLIADADVQRGGCIVHSQLGDIDARIEQRWAQAVAGLDAAPPWSPPQAEG